MERREFVTALGAAAATISVSRAFAEEAPVKHMHPPKYKALMESAGKCVSTGNECLRHCFGMLSMNDTSMAECTKASYDLVAACGRSKPWPRSIRPLRRPWRKRSPTSAWPARRNAINSRNMSNARTAGPRARPAPTSAARCELMASAIARRETRWRGRVYGATGRAPGALEVAPLDANCAGLTLARRRCFALSVKRVVGPP